MHTFSGRLETCVNVGICIHGNIKFYSRRRWEPCPHETTSFPVAVGQFLVGWPPPFTRNVDNGSSRTSKQKSSLLAHHSTEAVQWDSWYKPIVWYRDLEHSAAIQQVFQQAVVDHRENRVMTQLHRHTHSAKRTLNSIYQDFLRTLQPTKAEVEKWNGYFLLEIKQRL